MRPLAERLSLDAVSKRIREAYAASEMTLDELIERSGMDTTRASMSRKMKGKQGLDASDCEKLAKVFGFEVVITPSGIRTKAA
jgi:transcriptional regulator with XRE-family HTH domain